jgi:hypothetical protein
MKARKPQRQTDHSGSSFDSFLEEEGIREEVEAVAIKRVLAWHLEHAMQKQQKTKQAMAKQLRTSRSQLDRLLDPRNVSVTLDTITRAARAVGKRVIIRIADVKAAKRRRFSAVRTAEFFASRKESADFAAFDKLMKRRGEKPPREGDEMPKGRKKSSK